MMKKSNLWVGWIYLFAGIIFLLIALLTDSALESLLFGFAGAGIVPGLLMIVKYFYWSSPKNVGRYSERIAAEQIERGDELKEKLRDKSGRYAYILGILVISVSMVVFSVLDALEVIVSPRAMILFLGGYLVFQFIIGVVIFNRLLKKY
jgi:hypothetical protein